MDEPLTHEPVASIRDERPTLAEVLDDAPTSRFHHRAVLVSGMGFFTDAYDLFVIGTVATIVSAQWHLSTAQTSWVTGAAILGAFVGAFAFGRIADVTGRKTVYAVVAGVMVVGAVGSALAPNVVWLVIFRVVLGLGVGGDYPVSAVLMSEYSNRRDRGRLVGLVFAMQAVGLIVGPLVAIVLLGSGAGSALTWRLLLGLGAVPAAAVIYLRARMPESPRFRERVQGEGARAAAELHTFAAGALDARNLSTRPAAARALVRPWHLLTTPGLRRLVIGTTASWFLFDYAYYGNTLSLPAILKGVDPTASLVAKLWWSLALFALFALPGYALAVARMDRIGHRRLQWLGFAAMAIVFGLLAAVPVLTTMIAPFVALFGVSYFFTEFGPNTTTFVLPSEIFPAEVRTTAHGAAAGIGKLGAFVGVFLVPRLSVAIGLRGMLAVAAGAALVGVAATAALPEPARRSLDDVGDHL